MVLVTEDEMLQAMRWLVAEERMVVEPAAAAPIAALLQPARHWPGPIAAIITGQNLAPELVSAVTSTR
jgi:threonine dehydratase